MDKGPFLYYVRVKGWVGGIAKYVLTIPYRGGGLYHPYIRKKTEGCMTLMLFESNTIQIFNNNSYTMVTKKEKTETENKQEIFQNTILSRQF